MPRALLLGFLLLFLSPFADLSALYQDITFRVGSYFPSYGKMRRVYENGSPSGQIETAIHFAEPWEYMPWQAWFNATCISQGGHSKSISNAPFFPISIGLKHSWCLCEGWEVALGAGVVYSWLRIKDRSVSPRRVIVKHGWGGILKSSFRYWFDVDFFGELFIDYLITDFHYRGRKGQSSKVPHRLDMNGTLLGGGIGYVF